MSKVRVVRPEGTDSSRLFAIAFIRYFMRCCRRKMALFEGDLELALIAEAVAISSVDALLREPSFKAEFRSLSAVVGAERQRGVNGLSVAEATGLPRETVRRKLRRLVDLGIVEKRGNADFILRPGVIQGADYGSLFADLETETQRFFSECFDEGVLTIVDPTNES